MIRVIYWHNPMFIIPLVPVNYIKLFINEYRKPKNFYCLNWKNFIT